MVNPTNNSDPPSSPPSPAAPGVSAPNEQFVPAALAPVLPAPAVPMVPQIAPLGIAKALTPAGLVPASVATATDDVAEMPQTLKVYLKELEDWAVANQKDSRNDAVRFWALKIPAIIASASAGIFAYYNWHAGPLIAGAIASVCVVIDGLNPGGALKNAHYKAFFELRELEVEIQNRWLVDAYRTVSALEKQALASNIIDKAETKRAEIADNLKKAETALKDK